MREKVLNGVVVIVVVLLLTAAVCVAFVRKEIVGSEGHAHGHDTHANEHNGAHHY
jgi:hypothetical protein